MSIEHSKNEISKETDTYRMRPSVMPLRKVEATTPSNTEAADHEASCRLTPPRNERTNGGGHPVADTRKLKRAR